MPLSDFMVHPLSKHQEALPIVQDALVAEFEHQQGMELQDKEHLKEYLLLNSYVMVDITDGDDVIGFFSLSRINASMETGILKQALSFASSCIFGRMLIYDYCILAKHRKKGLGLVMMHLVEDYCLNTYPLVRYLELHTLTPSLSHFYIKCGFSLVKTHNGINTFKKSI
jgi:RimJ/RimL family protein N-acetyltransferase